MGDATSHVGNLHRQEGLSGLFCIQVLLDSQYQLCLGLFNFRIQTKFSTLHVRQRLLEGLQFLDRILLHLLVLLSRYLRLQFLELAELVEQPLGLLFDVVDKLFAHSLIMIYFEGPHYRTDEPVLVTARTRLPL